MSYILDAVGSSARAIYPNPRVWRPFMERVLADLTPEINKLYISLNRFLADRGVLPEIKAALRARSEFRPDDDRDLLPTFTQDDARRAARACRATSSCRRSLADPNAPPALVFADSGRARRRSHRAASRSRRDVGGEDPGRARRAGRARRRARGRAMVVGVPGGRRAARPPSRRPADFPSLDPLMALGTSTPLFATLAQWQRLDLPAAIAQAAPSPRPARPEGTVVPLNLIPHIRAAIDDQISNDTDRITMDVIALLFDYIFRDRSIPDSLRSLFGRLQVPIVKAALLDRTFFSDKKHPARQLLDHLAEAAVGATHDDAYQDAFAKLATELVDDICRDFEIDVGVFRTANAKLAAFIEDERQRVARPPRPRTSRQALDAEEGEADRSHVRAFLRDRLAGLDVPFEVRGFIETTWADYLADAARASMARTATRGSDAVSTLDDLLWSIVAKERTAQKARLTKMIPTLIGGLRKGMHGGRRAAGARPRLLRRALPAAHRGDQVGGAPRRSRRRPPKRASCRRCPRSTSTTT